MGCSENCGGPHEEGTEGSSYLFIWLFGRVCTLNLSSSLSSQLSLSLSSIIISARIMQQASREKRWLTNCWSAEPRSCSSKSFASVCRSLLKANGPKKSNRESSCGLDWSAWPSWRFLHYLRCYLTWYWSWDVFSRIVESDTVSNVWSSVVRTRS